MASGNELRHTLMSANLAGSLDTNIILRWILGDVTDQTPKTDLLINKEKNYRVSSLVIAEVVYILEAKGFRRSEIKNIISRLSAQLNLVFERSIIISATEMYTEHSSVSFVDACLLYESKTTNASPLYTFDKKLANKDSKNIRLL